MPSSQNLNLVELNGIRMDPKKIEAIKDWSRPITVIEVKSISGFSRLFQEICEGFLQYSSSLANLTRKNIKFNWTDRCEEYFLLLKNLLASAPLLTLPSGDGRYTV